MREARLSVADAIPHSSPMLCDEDGTAVAEALRSGMIAAGARVAMFERRVADAWHAPAAVATATGRTALTLALRSAGVRAGHDVLMPSYTCEAVLAAVYGAGGRPVLYDIGAGWVTTAAHIRAALTPTTRAVVVVHTFGIDAGVEPVDGIPLIEDCAHGYDPAARPGGVGRRGSYAVLSFHATKLLTTGEGGMVVANSTEAEQQLHVHSAQPGNGFVPMSDLQAALGLSQFRRFPEFLRRRKALAQYYLERLRHNVSGLPEALVGRSVFFRFPVRVTGTFESLRERFMERRVHVRRGVDELLHRRPEFGDCTFPGSEDAFAHTLSLPLYPALTDAEADQVCDAAVEILGEEG